MAFLDASSHPYKRVCLSIGPSVGPSFKGLSWRGTIKNIIIVPPIIELKSVMTGADIDIDWTIYCLNCIDITSPKGSHIYANNGGRTVEAEAWYKDIFFQNFSHMQWRQPLLGWVYKWPQPYGKSIFQNHFSTVLNRDSSQKVRERTTFIFFNSNRNLVKIAKKPSNLTFLNSPRFFSFLNFWQCSNRNLKKIETGSTHSFSRGIWICIQKIILKNWLLVGVWTYRDSS